MRLVGLILLVASHASAATFADVTMEDTATVADKSLVLNGMGLLEATVFNIDIYVAGLYLEGKSNDANEIIASSSQVKLIVQQFVREIGGKDLAKGFTEAFETASSRSPSSRSSSARSRPAST